MSRRSYLAFLALAALVATACTEKLEITGTCPEFCAGNPVDFRDTVIFAEAGGDTSYAGYPTFVTAPSLLVANGGAYGQARALLKFFPRGDSLLTDSMRAIISIDSIFIELVPQSWDASIPNQKLEVYRLPLETDTSATVAELDALMTPATFLRSIPLGDSSTSSPQYLRFQGDELEKLVFAPGEPTNLVIGLKLSSPTPTGMRLGAAPAGAATPSWTTWATVAVGEDSTTDAAAQRPVMDNISKLEDAPLPPGALRVGGLPAAKSFIRFKIPPFLRDSAILVRATLQLGLDGAVPGIPGDSSTLEIENLVANLGPKSPVSGMLPITTVIRSGQTGGLAFEVISLVASWQGERALPNIFRISSREEGASFTTPNLISTRQTYGVPSLRITWRPLFRFPGF